MTSTITDIHRDSNAIGELNAASRSGHDNLKHENTANPQGIDPISAVYDFADIKAIGALSAFDLQKAGFVPCQLAEVVFELTEAITIVADHTDIGRSGKFHEMDQWRAWLHVGVSLNPHKVSVVSSDNTDYATYRVACLTMRGFDIDSMTDASRHQATAAMRIQARAMEALLEKARLRNNTTLSAVSDNNDTRGFAFAVLGRMLLHNSALRSELRNKVMIQIGDEVPSTPNTYLTWEMSCSHGLGVAAITPIPQQWADTERPLAMRDRVLANAILKLADDTVGSVWVSVTGYDAGGGHDNVRVQYQTRADPLAWHHDETPMSDSTEQGAGAGEHFTVWKGDKGKTFLTMQLKQLYSRSEVIDEDAASDRLDIVYYLRGLKGHEAAVEFLLSQGRTGTQSMLPGASGIINNLHNESYGAGYRIKLATKDRGLGPVSFTKAEIATTTMALLRRYSVRVRAVHYAMVMCSQLMAATSFRDKYNGSVVTPTFRMELAPILAVGVQFMDMNDVDGSASPRDVGIGYDILAAAYALGAVPGIANACGQGSWVEEDSGVVVSRAHTVTDVAAIASRYAQYAEGVNMATRGAQGVKSASDYLLCQKMAMVYKQLVQRESKIFKLNEAYGSFADGTIARLRVSVVRPERALDQALDHSDLLKHSVQVNYVWDQQEPGCPVEFVPLPCPANVAHHATPAIATTIAVRSTWNAATSLIRDLRIDLEEHRSAADMAAGIKLLRVSMTCVAFGTSEALASAVLAGAHDDLRDLVTTIRADSDRARGQVAGVLSEARAGGWPALAKAATDLNTSVTGFKGRVPYSVAHALANTTADTDFINIDAVPHHGRMSTTPEAHRLGVAKGNERVMFASSVAVRDARCEQYDYTPLPTMSPQASALALRPESRKCVVGALNASFLALDVVPYIYGGGSQVRFGDAAPNGDHALVDENFDDISHAGRQNVKTGKEAEAIAVITGTLKPMSRLRARLASRASTPVTDTGASVQAVSAPPVQIIHEISTQEVEISPIEVQLMRAGRPIFESGLVSRMLLTCEKIRNESNVRARNALNAALSWPEVFAALNQFSAADIAGVRTVHQLVEKIGRVWEDMSTADAITLACAGVSDNITRAIVSVRDALDAGSVPVVEMPGTAHLYYWTGCNMANLQAGCVGIFKALTTDEPFQGCYKYDLTHMAGRWTLNDRRRVLIEAWNNHVFNNLTEATTETLTLSADIAFWETLALPVRVDGALVWTLGDMTSTRQEPAEQLVATNVRKTYAAVDYTRRRVASSMADGIDEVKSIAAEVNLEVWDALPKLNTGETSVSQLLANRAYAYVMITAYTGSLVPDSLYGVMDIEEYNARNAEFETDKEAFKVPAQ